MRVLILNEVCGHTSTGKICARMAEKMNEEGNEVRIAYGRDDRIPEKYRKFAVRIGNDFSVRIHGVATRLFDLHGFSSTRATKSFLSWAEEYDPDLIWLHNLHGYYINVELLFSWIKSRPDMQVKWTLHDSWSFTGHCAVLGDCDKWKTGCGACPRKKTYPASILFDGSRRNYERKRKAFTNVKNLSIITPSNWLAGLVKQSYLGQYPVEIVRNSIDKTTFKPTESDFRKRHDIVGKKMILAVSNAWQDPDKGLKDVYKLRKLLGEEYAIVIVGLTDSLMKTLPEGIIGIRKTQDEKELAGIYTTADILFNPTYMDNYPTVNLEAEACGTRVITYSSGGAAETIHRKDSVAIPTGDIEALVRLIKKV